MNQLSSESNSEKSVLAHIKEIKNKNIHSKMIECNSNYICAFEFIDDSLYIHNYKFEYLAVNYESYLESNNFDTDLLSDYSIQYNFQFNQNYFELTLNDVTKVKNGKLIDEQTAQRYNYSNFKPKNNLPKWIKEKLPKGIEIIDSLEFKNKKNYYFLVIELPEPDSAIAVSVIKVINKNEIKILHLEKKFYYVKNYTGIFNLTETKILDERIVSFQVIISPVRSSHNPEREIHLFWIGKY